MADTHECLHVDVSWLGTDWPDAASMETLARHAVHGAYCGASGKLANRARKSGAELSLVFADDAFVRSLNQSWRGKDTATNVLSFPANDTHAVKNRPVHLGDVVVARETLVAEAQAQNKPLDHHLAHLICHGTLHLLEYDHITDNDASEMESLETAILARLGIPDPYAVQISP